jgi:hypothetical protein
MHAVLLTVMALTGANDYEVDLSGTATAQVQSAYYDDAGYGAPCHCAGCSGTGCHSRGHGHRPHGGWFGMMPQTCYNPRFGCYDGDRFNHRYPAFHGTYYRRPYNYRNLFDYPWHAEPHEPTSMFSHQVNEPAPIVPAPVVVPSPAAEAAEQHSSAGLRSISHQRRSGLPLIRR